MSPAGRRHAKQLRRARRVRARNARANRGAERGWSENEILIITVSLRDVRDVEQLLEEVAMVGDVDVAVDFEPEWPVIRFVTTDEDTFFKVGALVEHQARRR